MHTLIFVETLPAVLMVRCESQQQSPFPASCMRLPRKAEQCDTPIIRAHPLVHCFKTINRCNIEEACLPRQPNNIQSLQHVRAGLHPTVPRWSFLTQSQISVTFGRDVGRAFPKCTRCAFNTERVLVEFSVSFTATPSLVGGRPTQQRPHITSVNNTSPHGYRPSHQELACELPLQAWIPNEASVSHIWARLLIPKDTQRAVNRSWSGPSPGTSFPCEICLSLPSQIKGYKKKSLQDQRNS